jgi:hypothetical protein
LSKPSVPQRSLVKGIFEPRNRGQRLSLQKKCSTRVRRK